VVNGVVFSCGDRLGAVCAASGWADGGLIVTEIVMLDGGVPAILRESQDGIFSWMWGRLIALRLVTGIPPLTVGMTG